MIDQTDCKMRSCFQTALFLTLIVGSLSSSSLGPILNGYDHFGKPIRAPLLTGGRLVSRHFEYLAQAGVASVISLYPLETTDEWKGVPGDWISSAEPGDEVDCF